MKTFFDKWLATAFHKIFNQKVRANLLQALPFWVSSLLAGLIAVLYTRLFSFSESLSHSIMHFDRRMIFLLAPVGFVLAWWLVYQFDRRATGSGIPQVMASIELATPRYNYLVDKFLSIKNIIIKILSTLLMVLGGGIIGREGPTVQIAGSVFRKVNQMIPASWPKISKKNMIMTGAAAGLAAAFNTPLGGIVFAVEELAKTHFNNFKTAIFTGVIIAGLTAQGFLGSYLYLGYPDINGISSNLIWFVALAAVIAGLTGALMSRAILNLLNWKRTLKNTWMQVAYVVGCALVIAIVAYFFNEGIMGSGKTQMSRLLFSSDKHVGFMLPVYRVLGSIACFTTGAAGGIFAPSLGAGATIGALIAEIFKFSAANANILILSGMVAFLTGVTRSPFTSAILVLEMTDRHSIVFYLMLAGMITSLVVMPIDKHSLYDHLKDNYLREAYHEDEQQGDRPVVDETDDQEP